MKNATKIILVVLALVLMFGMVKTSNNEFGLTPGARYIQLTQVDQPVQASSNIPILIGGLLLAVILLDKKNDKGGK